MQILLNRPPAPKVDIAATLEKCRQQGTMLPLRAIQENLPKWRDQYQSAQPFPHVVIDNLFDPQILDCIVSPSFPLLNNRRNGYAFRAKMST